MNEHEAAELLDVGRSDLPDRPFWMVVGINQGPPTVRHASRADADQEARRLAKTAPGVVFVVLEAVSATIRREFDTITFRASAEMSEAI